MFSHRVKRKMEVVLSAAIFIGTASFGHCQAYPTYPASPSQAQYQQTEREAMQLAQRVKKAKQGSDERGNLEKSLQGLVAKSFDARQKWQKEEAEELAKQLRALQERLERRTAARDKIIEKRVQDLLGEDPLRWDPNMPYGHAINTTPVPITSFPANDPYGRGSMTAPSGIPFSDPTIPPVAPKGLFESTKPGAVGPTSNSIPSPTLAPSSNSSPRANPNSSSNRSGDGAGMSQVIVVGFPDDLVALRRSTTNATDADVVRTLYESRMNILMTQVKDSKAELDRLKQRYDAGALDAQTYGQAQSRTRQLEALLEMYDRLNSYFSMKSDKESRIVK